MDTPVTPPSSGPSSGPGCSRRSLLRTLTAAGLVVPPGLLVAGCGGGSGGGSGGGPDGPDGPDGSSQGGASPSAVAASSVPVGTAVVVRVGGDRVVLAQPTAGRFVGYSAVCTHQSGIVGPGRGTVVVCPLHGSEFDAARGGKAVQGPATKALPTVPVTVQGDQLLVG